MPRKESEPTDSQNPTGIPGNTSPIVDKRTPASESTSATLCVWGGETFSPGARKCHDGTLYICQPNGRWYRSGPC